MSSLPQDMRDKMMSILKIEEDKTDLENLAVLSRVGMKVASATTSELDADATSASSTALIDLGLRLSEATAHGALTEIILHNSFGYSILQAINDDFIVFGGLKNVFRIGYYLGYLKELAKKLNRLISGDQITEMTLSLDAAEKAKLGIQDDSEDMTPVKPSLEQDKAALDDLLGFLDDWEKQGTDEKELESVADNNIVSIPKSRSIEHERQLIRDQASSQAGTESSAISSQFKVYDDEIPPLPLDDYTPMEIEEDASVQEPEIVQQPVPPLSQAELPALDELTPPDFESEMFESASEYETEFVLDKESEAFESILKDLGWDEEE
jgi:predicted regulator of Ras-like GTPase activity (Roadblock/LC7/MglB family)